VIGRGKGKFVVQTHIEKNQARTLFQKRKSEQFAKTITSKLRQAVKLGRNRH